MLPLFMWGNFADNCYFGMSCRTGFRPTGGRTRMTLSFSWLISKGPALILTRT
jgi:hypothetical protein